MKKMKKEKKILKKNAEKIHCIQCQKELAENSNVLFVEEDIGRVFCSENCIPFYFKDEIKYFEKELFAHRKSEEFSDVEVEQLNELRWPTLDHPDEAWMTELPKKEKTKKNQKKTQTKTTDKAKKDKVYTLISKYDFEDSYVWCVCITLLIRGFPSFLFISFLTREESVVNYYRKGKSVDLESIRHARTTESELREIEVAMKDTDSGDGEGENESHQDRLADPWTEEETLKSHTRNMRKSGDIKEEHFEFFEKYMEPTLEAPDELWVEQKKGNHDGLGQHYFRFIKKFDAIKEPHRYPEFYYIVLAKETDNDEELEVLDLFPTTDPQIIELYRQGVLASGDEMQELTYGSGGRHIH